MVINNPSSQQNLSITTPKSLNQNLRNSSYTRSEKRQRIMMDEEGTENCTNLLLKL